MWDFSQEIFGGSFGLKEQAEDSNIPKGSIAAAADFPTLGDVRNGWTYTATANVTDNDPTKTNTGQLFIAGQEFYWFDGAWVILGEDRLWSDDGTDLSPVEARSIDIPTGQTYKVNGVAHVHAHSDTTGKQGGTTDEYYHLTEDEHTKAQLETAEVTLYISPTGDDDTGDGSAATPYFSLHKCYSDLKGRSEYKTVNILAAVGTYDYSSLGNLYAVKPAGAFKVYIKPQVAYPSHLTVVASLTFNSPATYNHATTYGSDAVVKYDSTTNSGAQGKTINRSTRVYRSLQAANVGHSPLMNKDWWEDITEIHYLPAETLTPNEYKGKFLRTKTEYSSDTYSGTNQNLLPILRNGTNWVETAWGAYGSDCPATADVVDLGVIFNFGDNSIVAYTSGGYCTIWEGCKIIVNEIDSQYLSEEYSRNYMYCCDILCDHSYDYSIVLSGCHVHILNEDYEGFASFGVARSIVWFDGLGNYFDTHSIYNSIITAEDAMGTDDAETYAMSWLYPVNMAPGIIGGSMKWIAAASPAQTEACCIWMYNTEKIIVNPNTFGGWYPSVWKTENVPMLVQFDQVYPGQIIQGITDLSSTYKVIPDIYAGVTYRVADRFGDEISTYFDLEKGINAILLAPTEKSQITFNLKQNLDIDTGTEVVDSFTDTTCKAVRWDFMVSNSAGTAVRCGSINAVWDAAADSINDSDEYGVVEIGDTSGLTFTVTIAANLVTLSAVAASDNWVVKCQRYPIG